MKTFSLNLLLGKEVWNIYEDLHCESNHPAPPEKSKSLQSLPLPVKPPIPFKILYISDFSPLLISFDFLPTCASYKNK